MEKRNHHKTEIINVWPRKQWDKLRGRNQKLVMGYLVALTSKVRKANEYKKQRNEPIREMWWGIRVSIKEIASFLQKQTGASYSVCRVAAQRSLNHLHDIGYILIYKDDKNRQVDQYTTQKAIEVLWDDRPDVKAFFSPRFPELSKSGATFRNGQVQHFEASGATQVQHLDPSGATFQTPNVAPDNEEYGLVEPQNTQNEGASINTKLLITQNFKDPATNDAGQPSFTPSSHEAEKDTSVPPATHAKMPVVIPGTNFFDQSDLHPAYQVRQDPLRARFDKPADLLSFWRTPGIGNYPDIVQAAKRFIEYVKERYDFDCAYMFEAEHFRRLVCPDLRMDIPLEFGDVGDFPATNLLFHPERFERHLAGNNVIRDGHDMKHKIVSLLRYAPRGIPYTQDTGAYWHPPVMPLALDYSSYTRSSKTTESPFHRDASLSQVREIARFGFLPEVEVNGRKHTGLYFNIVLKRQIFWLGGVTAFTTDALADLLPRFEKDLLENSKSLIYPLYQKKIQSGDMGDVNLINWFRDFCFRYHKHGYYTDRIRNDEGVLLLSALDSNCMTSGPASGVIAYIQTPWGQNREMYFTDAQWHMYEKFKNTLVLPNIGQDSL